MAKETAEEKLLKMMQKPGAAPTSPGVNVPPKKKLSFTFSMHTLNQILMLGIAICVIGLIY